MTINIINKLMMKSLIKSTIFFL